MSVSLEDDVVMHGADDSDSELLRALALPSTYPGHPVVTVRETHASWVFLAGDCAYKVKKPLALGFLDYSTLALRHGACREEVRVNRALAADIYLGVLAIVRGRDGYRLADEDASGALEYAVAMRRFRERDTLAGTIAAGDLTHAHVVAVARRLAEFHRAAPVVAEWRPERVREMWRANVNELRDVPHPDAWRIDVLDTFGDALLARYAHELSRRGLAGLARDGHGDLRCEHILLEPDVRVVDRIEFDPELRRTDVACDLAFLAMDLEALGQVRASRELYGAYRHAGGLRLGSAQLRAFYAAHWALVRAKVALIAASEHRGGREAAQAALVLRRRVLGLFALAERLCWRARSPVALVICGPAASGKSTLAVELARRSGFPLVSSDRVRKRLAGFGDAHAPAGPEHYTARFTRATYEQLAHDALVALGDDGSGGGGGGSSRGDDDSSGGDGCAGEPDDGDTGGVIVDATCRSRPDRALLFERLHRAGLTRIVVHCTVPLEVALERATRRMGDPARVSDATPEIVAAQFRAWDALDELAPMEVLALDTAGPPARPLDDQVAEVALAVDRRIDGCMAERQTR